MGGLGADRRVRPRPPEPLEEGRATGRLPRGHRELGGPQQVPARADRIPRGGGGPLQERRGGRVAGALPGARRRGLERRRHEVVGADGGLGQVPGALLEVAVAVEGLGERPMRVAAARGIHQLQHDRPQERVAQARDVSVQDEEARRLRGDQVAGASAESLERCDDRPGGAAVADGGHAERPPCSRVEALHAPPIGLDDRLTGRQGLRQRHASRALAAAQGAGQLDQCQGVPPGQGEDLPRHRRGQGPGDGHGLQQGPRLLLAERRDLVALDLGHREPLGRALPRGDEHRDGLVRDPACAEHQRLPARRVHPVAVVDQDQHRAVGGDRSQQAQRGRIGGVAVESRRGAQGEGRAQRGPLGLGDAVDPGEHRAQHVGEHGEGEPRFRLHPPGREDAQAPLLALRAARAPGACSCRSRERRGGREPVRVPRARPRGARGWPRSRVIARPARRDPPAAPAARLSRPPSRPRPPARPRGRWVGW